MYHLDMDVYLQRVGKVGARSGGCRLRRHSELLLLIVPLHALEFYRAFGCVQRSLCSSIFFIEVLFLVTHTLTHSLTHT